MENTLTISSLNKTYENGVKALQDINITISNGLFGLLGPNGAGKSSLMRTLATLQSPDEGSILLNDIDVIKNPFELRKQLGYLPQEFGVYPKITAYQLLDHIATLKGITKSKERKEVVHYLLQKVNLFEQKDKYVKSFSGGMKRRIGIAQALINNPRLIIVDEPTAGLDPSERNRFYNLLAQVGQDVIIILSTHIVEDVHELCTQMAIMNHGKIVYTGNPEDAIGNLKEKIFRKKLTHEEVDIYKEKYNVISNKMIAGKPVIRIFQDIHPQDEFEQVLPNLEDVFFTHTSIH